jgi:hypothetical protein
MEQACVKKFTPKVHTNKVIIINNNIVKIVPQLLFASKVWLASILGPERAQAFTK